MTDDMMKKGDEANEKKYGPPRNEQADKSTAYNDSDGATSFLRCF